MQYKPASHKEFSLRKYFDEDVGVKMDISLNRELTDTEKNTIDRYTEIVLDIIVRNNFEKSEQGQAAVKKHVFAILQCFGEEHIYAEHIVNQYCSHTCCLDRPWLKVTTKIGVITIGWRKRVISIDWSQSKNTKTAQELFPNENVTKEKHLIHADGYEMATKYLEKIVSW